MEFDIEQTRQDIKEAIELIRSYEYRTGFSKYSSSFIFGTENQQEINKIVRYSQKTVLTPASSGDQYISSVYYDAEKTDIFDINRITFYVTYLKIAAIMLLDYEVFIRFFFPLLDSKKPNPLFWNLSILKGLLKVLPKNVAYFWDNIIFEMFISSYGNLVCPSDPRFTPKMIKNGMPFYGDKGEYYKLQAKLRKKGFPKFFEADILNLGELLVADYDFFYLSNIFECLVADTMRGSYYYSPYKENQVEFEKAHAILDSIEPHLRPNGLMLMNYRQNNNRRIDWISTCDLFDVTAVPCKIPPMPKYGNYDNVDLVYTYKPKKQRH